MEKYNSRESFNFDSKLTEEGYELESVNIVQSPSSPIRHRSECDPMIELAGRKVFPVIVSPMGAVTDENNYKVWLDNGFIPVVPRTVDLEKRIKISEETFASFSLSETENNVLKLSKKDENDIPYKRYICIDIAHGTMEALYDVCKKLRKRFGENIVIMTGNVANPEAYIFYEDAGIDYMRCSVGAGSRCVTSCNVGIHYPTASLIDGLRMQKERYEFAHGSSRTKIIADGGIKNFDEIQKCICLGADAVMSGNIFARAEEACEPIVFLHPDNLNMADAIPQKDYLEKIEYLREYTAEYPNDEEMEDAYRKLMKRKPYREYYGMSTKKAQKITGGSGKKTSEGIIRPIPVEYPIAKWAENMKDYMTSCMSYTGCRTIEEMKRETRLIINKSGDGAYKK